MYKLFCFRHLVEPILIHSLAHQQAILYKGGQAEHLLG